MTVASSPMFSFEKSSRRRNLTSLVVGPDGAPYVIDKSHEDRLPHRPEGQEGDGHPARTASRPRASRLAAPKMLTTGGLDLLILDAKNVLWRWRPADAKGNGTLSRVLVNGALGLGHRHQGDRTFLRGDPEQALYNLYVVDPSAKQILRYSPAADGSGYPAAPTGFLATAQALDDVDAMFIDGDVYLAEAGGVKRFVGRAGRRLAGDRPWRHRPANGAEVPGARIAVGPSGRAALRLRQGQRADRGHRQGERRLPEQYRVTLDPGWKDLRGMYVLPGGSGDPPRSTGSTASASTTRS